MSKKEDFENGVRFVINRSISFFANFHEIAIFENKRMIVRFILTLSYLSQFWTSWQKFNPFALEYYESFMKKSKKVNFENPKITSHDFSTKSVPLSTIFAIVR